MTSEEAIKRIKVHITVHRFNDPNAIRISEALNMAIRSLEACKQIQTMVFDHLGDWDSDADEVIINIKDVLKEVEDE